MTGCSVIIPAYGRTGLTRSCVDAVLAAGGRAPLEVIVVDDGTMGGLPLGDDLPASVRVVRRDETGGYARACNAGADAARFDRLLFLNNDTLPQAGWLDTLLDHMDRHPEAAVTGARLLYPDGTVQHAGVTIGADGQPRNLYTGLPGDHPAVQRSRPVVAVTGACMLIRADAFRGASGFDPDYVNGLEDVDLCLRLARRGHAILYCAESVVVHLESVTRGRRSADIEAGIRTFRERWSHHLRPDDMNHYIRDGLLRVSYDERHPVRIEVDPAVGVAETAGGATHLEDLLLDRSRHLTDLLQDTVRLTAALAERGPAAAQTARPSPDGRTAPADTVAAPGPEFEERILDIERMIVALQRDLRLAAADGDSPRLAYRILAADTREAVERLAPAGATVLVVSRGDDALVSLVGPRGAHFPQAPDGRWAGAYPASGAEAVAHLEALRERGAAFLVFPDPARWWLEAYPELAAHLGNRYAEIGEAGDPCLTYDLRARRDASRPPLEETAGVRG